MKRGLYVGEQRQWSNASFSDTEFRELLVGVEGLVAVQWEPTGRSNRAIPLGGTGDNSSQPVHTSKELPDCRTKTPIDSDIGSILWDGCWVKTDLYRNWALRVECQLLHRRRRELNSEWMIRLFEALHWMKRCIPECSYSNDLPACPCE